MIGKVGVSMYVGRSHIASAFGSTSVLTLLLLLVYYTSQIIFLGASFIYVISAKLGYVIKPNNNAVKIKNVEIQ